MGCAHQGIRLSLCLVDAAHASMECVHEDGSKYQLPMGQADNYVCFPPDQFEAFENYCRERH